MIRYLIIDDEPVAHSIINEYCDMLPYMKLTGQCYSALEALEFLNTTDVDLIFLDLNMPQLKGFEFLKTLSKPPLTIVTTAYKEFALESYDLNVVDYLLKPFSFERFLKALNKVVQPSPSLSIPTETTKAPSKSIFLRSHKKYIQVFLPTILFIEASGNYTKVFTTEETISIRSTFSELSHKLLPEGFIQVHKSFAVAKVHIKSIEGNRIIIGTHQVPIAKSYKPSIQSLLGSS